ncbi:hypothetical protein [Legionella israelensis]|uniref:Uncharacterized protein n=1 Tax=Legionella israelensis TaxID=454 RepID=A0A0W0VEJ1_9GAMM|nr:hypothetical protein [Legionella israelensis]KTD18527.1 hypothetical protein Lisr_2156 [Legionella israelensis]QBS10456.1 hypothetical protein E4T55_11670 [Legionella israelensis]SCY47904.1 hypothetical protein SAMN02746069_02600 [Legionella israelensis DSM 19235]STX60081.1 Uncharacterised protein [Legionella israelensis]
MPIGQEEIIELSHQFHNLVMVKKGNAEQQSEFFLYPEPRIFLLHGEDISLQKNHEIHQKLIDEIHIPQKSWLITPLCNEPERVRAVGCVYWEGRVRHSKNREKIKCFVGEDWIVQRTSDGQLKFVLYINAYHHFLPDSAMISF